jgi:hypothetical protein
MTIAVSDFQPEIDGDSVFAPQLGGGKRSMKKSLLFAAAGAALLAASPAAAQQWRVVSVGGAAPDRAVYLVDVDSIEQRGDRLALRTMTVWETPAEAGNMRFNRSITTREADCKQHGTAMMANAYYLDGELLVSDTLSGKFSVHPNGSVMGDVVDAVCGNGEYITQGLSDPEGAIRAWFADK